MYKLEGCIKNFRIGNKIFGSTYEVTWYKLIEEKDSIRGVPLSKKELDQVTFFFANTDNNKDTLDYRPCKEGEELYFDIYDLIRTSTTDIPQYLIIRCDPKSKSPDHSNYGDIVLLNQNGKDIDQHKLPFAIIGEIRS